MASTVLLSSTKLVLLITEGYYVGQICFLLFRYMLTNISHFLYLNIWKKFQKDFLHHLHRDGDEAGKPVVFHILLIAKPQASLQANISFQRLSRMTSK